MWIEDQILYAENQWFLGEAQVERTGLPIKRNGDDRIVQPKIIRPKNTFGEIEIHSKRNTCNQLKRNEKDQRWHAGSER